LLSPASLLRAASARYAGFPRLPRIVPDGPQEPLSGLSLGTQSPAALQLRRGDGLLCMLCTYPTLPNCTYPYFQFYFPIRRALHQMVETLTRRTLNVEYQETRNPYFVIKSKAHPQDLYEETSSGVFSSTRQYRTILT
jgi:hypothetical protein